jgi:uncharacterized cupredoxin-like copper-binding protein
MWTTRQSVLLAAAFVMASCLSPLAEPHGAGHGHSHGFSAGEPGNPGRPARVVNVTMQEAAGKMTYSPARVAVKRGDQVRFVLTNVGELDHEFVLATTEENLRHAKEMQQHPAMEHDNANAKRLAPKQKSEVLCRFTKRGSFEFGCLIPGHREAGMTGTVVVD